jgi:hypothetical protein
MSDRMKSRLAFLRELWRVARRGLFVTTPNRWFPIEVHTVLPLVHYLPPSTFRAILRRLGREFSPMEANLNLMSRTTLSHAARLAGVDNFRVETMSLRMAIQSVADRQKRVFDVNGPWMVRSRAEFGGVVRTDELSLQVFLDIVGENGGDPIARHVQLQGPCAFEGGPQHVSIFLFLYRR